MLNISELTCRVCLQERDVLVNIYDELEDFNTQLSNLLETHGGFQINKNDIFPKYLCEDCTTELLITSKFREKCEKSKEIYYKLLENKKLIGNEEELSNSSDIIEYCVEDSNDDLIVKNLEINDEQKSEKITDEELVEENIVSSLEKNIESIGETELDTQTTIKNVREDTSIFNDFTNQPDLNTEECVEVEPENVSGDKTVSMITLVVNAKTKRTHIFKCDVCGAKFKQAINLQKHLQKSHDATQFYICNKCDHHFSLETEYFKHFENCNYLECNTELSTACENSKADRIIVKAAETEHSRNCCMYCKRDFPTPFALRMHLRTHTGERPFQCKYCTKSFKTQSQLNVHHKRHTGQADFICSICNKAFYEQSNLTVHMHSHTGERPHVCTICNKTFNRVFLLQFHMRTHTGEKPFKCNYCEKSFRQHADLRSHLTVHTGQKQHTCTLCGKSYIKRSHLAQHMRKHQVTGSAELSERADFKCEQSRVEPNTAANNIQSYIQNPEIIYSFDEIIESEDVVIQA